MNILENDKLNKLVDLRNQYIIKNEQLKNDKEICDSFKGVYKIECINDKEIVFNIYNSEIRKEVGFIIHKMMQDRVLTTEKETKEIEKEIEKIMGGVSHNENSNQTI